MILILRILVTPMIHELINPSENNCDPFYNCQISSEPHLTHQNEFSDLVRRLEFIETTGVTWVLHGKNGL